VEKLELVEFAQGFYVVVRHQGKCNKCEDGCDHITLYRQSLLYPECMCCGQTDHGFLCIFEKDRTDRVICPVSRHEGSYFKVKAKDPGDEKFEINPWRFAKHYNYNLPQVEEAWDTFLTKGHGQFMRGERRTKLWQGVAFYCRRFEQGHVLETSPKSLLWMRDVREDTVGLAVELKYLDSIPEKEALGEMTEQEIRTCHSCWPCYWCGSQEHSVLGDDAEGEDTAITCPLARGATVTEYSKLPSPESFVEVYGLDPIQLDEALDVFEYQGIGWQYDTPTMRGYRKLVLDHCQNIRSQWTFKRTVGEEILDLEEPEDQILCA